MERNIDIDSLMSQENEINESLNQEKEVKPVTEDKPAETEKKVNKTADRGDGSVDVIQLSNITHIFNQGQPNEYKLFENFNLTIPDIAGAGQFISIMGASGCGKSQMLKVIAGLNKFDQGTVKVYGKELDENHSFPMVFQTYSNFEWYTVLENVMLPMLTRGIAKPEAEKRAKDLLERVGLADHINKSPAKLSGGQQQRVAIARCLACDSQIILFDEATGALDIKMKREVQNIMLKIFYDKTLPDPTIINVSHSIEEVCYLSNKVFILQANPCRIFKEVDIHYTGEETRERGEWVFETQEFANYVKLISGYMDSISK